MPSITDLLVSGLPRVSAQYMETVGEPTHMLDNLREQDNLHDLHILPFKTGTDLSSKTMVAIDGGRTSQKLAIGDLIVVGATVGEAAHSIKLYAEEDDVPAYAHATIVPHTSENDNLEQSMMAMMELQLLQQTKADVKIIDGGYLGNIATLFFGLFGRSTYSTKMLLEVSKNDENRYIRDAVDTILYPKQAGSKEIVAVTKSDSSFEFSKKVFGQDSDFRISDRILASRLLHPGEFFGPRPLIAPRQIINKLEKMDLGAFLKDFTTAEATVLRELFLGKDGRKSLDNKRVNTTQRLKDLDNEDELKSLLWTTYFKPTAWRDFSPAIRIEFTHQCTPTSSAADRAQELISHVDQDIITEEFLEPWSQYKADRRAKDVSIGTDLVKNYLTSNIEDPSLSIGLLRNYRS